MYKLPPPPIIPESTIRTCIQNLLSTNLDSVTLPKYQGLMHSIFKLGFRDTQLSQVLSKRNVILRETESQNSLILRVAAKGIQNSKLENEATVYLWLARNTTIPVPQIIHYDSSTENIFEREYMLMTHVLGEDGASMYKNLSPPQMDQVLDQLADHFIQLSQHVFHHIGGLRSTSDGGIGPGPVINEVHWTEADIVIHFPPGTLASDINPSSATGFSSYTTFLSAYMRCYLHAIRIQPALTALSLFSSTNLSLLERFIDVINQAPLSNKLNEVPCILAHRDLHFGQLLLDPQTCRITAILDWEFAQVVPFPLWIKGFLWDGDTSVPWSSDVSQERKRLRRRWEERVRMKKDDGEAVRALEAQKWRCEEQKAAWDVVNCVRWIVETTPRGVHADNARTWWDEVVKALKVLGIRCSDVTVGKQKGHNYNFSKIRHVGDSLV